MAKSTEYPDLTWVPPRAFGSGRDGKAVRFIVVHYTAGAERNTSAEDGASYDARRGMLEHAYRQTRAFLARAFAEHHGALRRAGFAQRVSASMPPPPLAVSPP
jgi:hypothetical protein